MNARARHTVCKPGAAVRIHGYAPARVLRSWRQLQRQPANYRPVLSVVRVARGAYRVTHQSGETATLIVEHEA